MKIVKIALSVILIIIAIPLILGLFVDESFVVEQEITVNQPEEKVFNYLKHIKNQKEFSVWELKDPNLKKTFTGTDGQIGFISAWESENDEVGKGSQKITKIINNERIETKLLFIEPFESESSAYFITESKDSGTTQVTWGFSGKFSYPTNAMLLFIDMNDAMGKDLSDGLHNLKKILEN